MREQRETPGSDGRAPARSPLRFAAFLLAAAAVVLAAALGAGADHTVVLHTPESGARFYSPPKQKEKYGEAQWGQGEEKEREPEKHYDGSVSIMVALIVIVATPVVVLLVWLVRRIARIRLPDPPDAGVRSRADLFTVEQAQETLRFATQRLHNVGDPHEAVVAAWLELERAVAEHGPVRAPQQTTAEYVTAVLAGVDLDRERLGSFAELYRRALFDARPLTDADRAAAIDILDALAAQLTAEGTTDRGRAR